MIEMYLPANPPTCYFIASDYVITVRYHRRRAFMRAIYSPLIYDK